MENIQKATSNYNETQIELPARFIQKAEYPFKGEILSVQAMKGRYGIEYRVTMQSKVGFRDFDLWGDNLWLVAEAYGKIASAWIGKHLLIELKENNIRRVTPYA